MKRMTRSSKILALVASASSGEKGVHLPQTPQLLTTRYVARDDKDSVIDYDSDDSIFDKDYEPPRPPKYRDIDSDSDIFIENSQPHVIVAETPEPDIPLTHETYIPLTPEPNISIPHEAVVVPEETLTPDLYIPLTPEPNISILHEAVVVPEETLTPDLYIPLTPEPNISIPHEAIVVPEETLTPDLPISHESGVPEIDLTKKGYPRKRRAYKTSAEYRKQQKKEEKILTHYAVKPGCDDSRKKCWSKINEDRRLAINKLYWSMTWAEQKYFIINNTSSGKPTKIKELTGKQNRNRTTYYFLKDDTGARISVCRAFFLTTLGYKKTNEKVIRTALKNEECLQTDGRGKSTKNVRINRQHVLDHIESYHPTISHYRREHAPKKRYLTSELTIQSMYNDFTENHPNVIVSYDYYRKALQTLNISFAKLGHEECETCEAFGVHNPNPEIRHRKCESCINFEQHHSRYILARQKYNEDRNHKLPGVGYFSVDLQKVIMLPRIDVFKSVLFCPRLVAFNESFVPLGDKSSDEMTFASIWHEAIAGRKRDDIASTFGAFLKHYRDLNVIVLWLDNCAAQNKNWALFCFFVYIINSNEICANKIILKYFESGHTFMSADEFHHQVEDSLKRKNKVYDFNDFADAVALTNNRKTIVKKMSIEDFYDIADESAITKLQKTEARPYLREMSEICFQRTKFNLFYKCSFNDEEYIELDFLKQKAAKKGSVPKQRKTVRGITSQRKNTIINKLGPLMPLNRTIFWENLAVNDQAVNLAIADED